MDPRPLGEEDALRSEPPLPGFPDGPEPLCSEVLGQELCLDTRDVGLGSLDTDLNALLLLSARDCGSLWLLHEPGPRPAHEPELPVPPGPQEAREGGGGSVGVERSPPVPPRPVLPGCSRCRKAFKCQHHLSGQVLTHQKTKPFSCPERGCGKSYCDRRSLRRHRGLQHGTGAAPPGSPLSRGIPAGRITKPGTFPPKPGPLGRAVTGFAHQPLPSDSSGGSGVPEAVGDPKDPLWCPGSAAPAGACAAVNAGSVPAVAGVAGGSSLPEAAGRGGWRCCPSRARLRFPGSPGQELPVNPLDGDSPWVWNVPGRAEPQGSGICLARQPQGGSGGLPGPSHSCEHRDASPLPAAPSRAKEELALGWFEEAFQELSFLDVPKHGETRQLLPDPPDPAPCPELLNLFQVITTSAPAPPAAPEAAQPPPGPFQAGFQEPTAQEGPCTSLPKAVPQFQGAASDGEKPGPPTERHRGLRDPSAPAQLQAAAPGSTTGSHSSQTWNQLENAASAFKPERTGKAGSWGRLLGTGWSWRLPAERPGPPSQVAMASFSAAPVAPGPRRLTIFNRIQGGLIYGLAAAERDPGAGGTAGAAPADGSGSGFPHQSDGQPRHVPESHECLWGRKEEQQVTKEEIRDGKDPKGNSHPRKRRRQTQPKSLLIPAPPAAAAPPGLGGCYQSNLRSPVLLVDHLLRDLFQCSPYTPPPMLSPVREGSGLYCSTLRSSAGGGDPDRLLRAVLGRVERDFGFRLLGDSARIRVQPHINVGSEFQAEIPDLRERSQLEEDEEVAALVWKPWGDIVTNPETQHRVTALLDTACSSAVPGGGTNIELALHCLHEARGDVLEALEVLLSGGAPKPESHPLADYHYAGSDAWVLPERRLFQRALSRHKKDFHLIQKEIRTKTVSQCVEYYYTWKKQIKLDTGRARVVGKKVKRDEAEVEEAGEEAVCSPRTRPQLLPKGSPEVKQSPEAPGIPIPAGSGANPGVFPCEECERVFDRIKARNAHMKRHRLPQPLLRVEWPWKRLKAEPRAEGTRGSVA
ncbi:zinc finger protein 541 [Aegotheles albertisi]